MMAADCVSPQLDSGLEGSAVAPALSGGERSQALDATDVQVPRLRVLELFAGLGGFRLALSYAGIDVDATAVEVSQQALRVYAKNFGEDGIVTRDIRGLSAAWFERQRCRVWTMSPPCQPYTRQGCLRDAEDPRALPLLHIIDVLREINEAPEAIVLENVQNFERSESCRRLLEVLSLRGYHWRAFLLSPRQLGFPNARQRFYLVAKLRRWPFDHVPEPTAQPAAGVVCPTLSSLPCSRAERGVLLGNDEPSGSAESPFVDATCASCNRLVPTPSPTRLGCCTYDVPPIARFVDDDCATSLCKNSDENGVAKCITQNGVGMVVPESTMRKEAARCFDVVHADCQHSLCFTKAYGRYVDGTGSILLMPQRAASPSAEAGDYTMRGYFGFVRYFSPREVARLLGFKLPSRTEDGSRHAGPCLPPCTVHECEADRDGHAGDDVQQHSRCRCEPFDLPDVNDTTAARELWALLGNSLNPQVVGLVCRACQISEIARAPASMAE